MKRQPDVSPALRARWRRSREVTEARRHIACFISFIHRVRPGVLPADVVASARACPECSSPGPRTAVVLPLVRPTKQEPR
jgi:hypothetical protein